MGSFPEAADGDMDQEVVVAFGDGGPTASVEHPVGIGGGRQVRNLAVGSTFPMTLGG
jgi:hypothetical protein